MNTNNNWKDYECIKTGNGEKLERWNNIILIRPEIGRASCRERV